MKKLKHVLSFVLAFALILSGMTVVPAQSAQADETDAAVEYKIYPTPHSIVYRDGGGFYPAFRGKCCL